MSGSKLAHSTHPMHPPHLTMLLLGILVAALVGLLAHHRLRSYGLAGSKLPVLRGWIPYFGCGLSFVRHPRRFLEQTRQTHGDTFVTFLFGIPLLWVFSPTGLKSLYTMRESDASFTEATRGLLGLKLPAEIVQHGDMRKFHAGLHKSLLPSYLRLARDAVQASLAQLPATGRFEIFAQMKMLVHRVGFLCWVGSSACKGTNMEQLISAFEILDPETSFKHLGSLTTSIVNGKRAEKAALDSIETIITRIWNQRDLVSQATADSGVRDNLAALHSL
jgi:hypothetical protein